MATVLMPLAPEAGIAATRSVKASVRRSVSFMMSDVVLVLFRRVVEYQESQRNKSETKKYSRRMDSLYERPSLRERIEE
jgi:hypothetical protein